MRLSVKTPHAGLLASHLGSSTRTSRGPPAMLDALPTLVRHFAEPFGDSSALAVWMLARETRKHVTVVLTGDGGDEGVGGYDWDRTALRPKRLGSVGPLLAPPAPAPRRGRAWG